MKLHKPFGKPTITPPRGNANKYPPYGTWHTTKLAKATALAQTYASRMQPNPPTVDPTTYQTTPPAPKDEISPFTLHELQAQLKTLKNKMAPGLDGVQNEIRKCLPEAWEHTLLKIYNQLLKYCQFPAAWRMAKVTPIPKLNKNPAMPENHRPISLLSNLRKLYERRIATRLMKEADRLKTLPDEQFGFRPGHSTSMQLLRVMEYLTTAANDNQKSLFVALDIEAAFDGVPTDELSPKLAAMGFHPQLTFLIHNVLINRFMTVAVEVILSPIVSVGAGVPQGGVLSPLLYCTSCTPMTCPAHLSQHFTRTTPLTSSPVRPPRMQLTTPPNGQKNPEPRSTKPKPSFCIFNPAGGRRPNLRVLLNGQSLSPSSSLTYLGVAFHQQLSFLAHVKKTTARANNRFFALKRHLTCHTASRPIWERFYPTTIQPIMLYGVEILSTIGQEALRQLEVTERNMLRQIYNLDRRAGNAALYQANIQPLAKVIHHRAKEALTAAAQNLNPLIKGQYEELGYTYRRPGDLTASSSSSDESDD